MSKPIKVKTGCDSCEFNMPDTKNDILVCAGREDLYGKPIPNIKDGCPEYEMCFSEFCRLKGEYDKYSGEYVGVKDEPWLCPTD